MPRRRFQRGTLRAIVPAHGGDPERKLPRGTYWATWYRYVRQADLLHTRAIWKHARKRKIITENPTEDLRAKSKQRVSERYLTLDECRQLLSVLASRDHLIVRMFFIFWCARGDSNTRPSGS
jgi:hypothetical protein